MTSQAQLGPLAQAQEHQNAFQTASCTIDLHRNSTNTTRPRTTSQACRSRAMARLCGFRMQRSMGLLAILRTLILISMHMGIHICARDRLQGKMKKKKAAEVRKVTIQVGFTRLRIKLPRSSGVVNTEMNVPLTSTTLARSPKEFRLVLSSNRSINYVLSAPFFVLQHGLFPCTTCTKSTGTLLRLSCSLPFTHSLQKCVEAGVFLYVPSLLLPHQLTNYIHRLFCVVRN